MHTHICTICAHMCIYMCVHMCAYMCGYIYAHICICVWLEYPVFFKGHIPSFEVLIIIDYLNLIKMINIQMQESSKNTKQMKYKLYKTQNFKALGRKDENVFVTEE